MAAVACPRPSPWSHWIAKVMIADFVRSAFKFFPFLNLHKHIISKVLVRSLNSTNLLSQYKVQNWWYRKTLNNLQPFRPCQQIIRSLNCRNISWNPWSFSPKSRNAFLSFKNRWRPGMIFTPARAVDSPELSSREGQLIFIQEIYLEHPWVGGAGIHYLFCRDPSQSWERRVNDSYNAVCWGCWWGLRNLYRQTSNYQGLSLYRGHYEASSTLPNSVFLGFLTARRNTDYKANLTAKQVQCAQNGCDSFL